VLGLRLKHRICKKSHIRQESQNSDENNLSGENTMATELTGNKYTRHNKANSNINDNFKKVKQTRPNSPVAEWMDPDKISVKLDCSLCNKTF